VSGQSVFLLRILRVGAEELTIQQLIQEQRTRIHSGNPAERFAAALLIPAVLSKRLRLLDDRQIGQLLANEVWSNLNLLAPESTICLAAADRLRRHGDCSPERKGFGIRRRARRSWAAELLPFQRNKFASNTFMVPSVDEAKACLCHAGFREIPRFPSLLVDIQTGRSIRLYEDRT
jgi:hypothetical protein